ncbi:hypothetical protein MRX96_006253 [Rhipicephalus microplus]
MECVCIICRTVGFVRDLFVLRHSDIRRTVWPSQILGLSALAYCAFDLDRGRWLVRLRAQRPPQTPSWNHRVQELPNGLDVRQPTAHAPYGDVNKENSSVSAQKQSYANSSSLAMHTETKDPEADSTKFSSVPKSQGLPKGLVVRQPTAHAPSEDLNKENSSISAQKQSSSNSSTLTVHTEAKDLEAGSTKISLVPKSLGLTSGRVVRPSTSRAPSKDANKEDISGSTQHESSTSSSSLTVHKETKSPEAGSTKFSSVPKSQGLPNGLVIRQPTAHAPSEEVNKENSSISAQKQSSADSSTLTVHTETKDLEAGSTKFSLVPKSLGLTSGRVVRPSTACAPSKNANKENISSSAQHHSSTNYSSLTVHKETKSPEAGSTKFSPVPKSQGLPSGLVVRPPSARAPSKNANKENISGSAQHPSPATYSSLMVQKETRDPEAGSTKFSSVPKSQGLPSGLAIRPSVARAPSKDTNKESISSSAQPHSSINYSSLMVHKETKSPEAGTNKFSPVPKSQGLPSGLVVQPPTACAPSKNANKQNISSSAQHPSSATYSSLMVQKETKDPEAGSTKFSSVPKSQGLLSGLAVRPSITCVPSKDANKESISSSAQHHSSTNYSSLTVHKETKSPEAGSTKFSSVPKSQGLPSGLVVRPPSARAPSKNANKENISGSAQHPSPATYSSLMVQKETRDPEAGSTKFSSVPKSQGLPSGLAIRPSVARAPSKDTNKESISSSAQPHSSINYSSLMVHKETKSPEAGTNKFSPVPKSQGLHRCQRAKDFRVVLSFNHPLHVHPPKMRTNKTFLAQHSTPRLPLIPH